MMHGHEKSSSAIVAVKPTNKVEHIVAEQSATERTAAEPVEPRAEAEGNGRPAPHAPGTVPGTRAPGAGLHTAHIIRRGYPRWEPYAGKLHVRVCAGGARQLASLPRRLAFAHSCCCICSRPLVARPGPKSYPTLCPQLARAYTQRFRVHLPTEIVTAAFIFRVKKSRNRPSSAFSLCAASARPSCCCLR